MAENRGNDAGKCEEWSEEYFLKLNDPHHEYNKHFFLETVFYHCTIFFVWEGGGGTPGPEEGREGGGGGTGSSGKCLRTSIIVKIVTRKKF